MLNMLALLADIANGIFAVVLAGLVTNTEIAWWHFLIGIPLAMCPDLDAIPELLQRGKTAASQEHTYDHREGLHYPVSFLFVGGILIIYAPFFGWMFLFAVALHFLNDFYGTGWGVKLFWPFTNRRYKLLGRRVNRLKSILVSDNDWELLTESERKLRFVVTWSESELPGYIDRWGLDNWLLPYYLRLNWISVIEYLLFLVAVVLLVVTLVY